MPTMLRRRSPRNKLEMCRSGKIAGRGNVPRAELSQKKLVRLRSCYVTTSGRNVEEAAAFPRPKCTAKNKEAVAPQAKRKRRPWPLRTYPAG